MTKNRDYLLTGMEVFTCLEISNTNVATFIKELVLEPAGGSFLPPEGLHGN